MVDSLHSYPKVWALGHAAIASLLDGPVWVQEKADGSQFSFGVINGQLHCRSKGAILQLDENCNSIFKPSVETVKRAFSEGKLTEGWIYRGEALCKPKHNVLCYERVPLGNIALFDIDTGLEQRMPPSELAAHAAAIGVDVVPYFYTGEVKTPDEVKAFLDRDSFLGGCKLEGVVIKNYARWGLDGKMLMGKYVSEAFKEIHGGGWRKMNPSRGDILDTLIARYRTPARWDKARFRLRDGGTLQGAPQDIGPLMKTVNLDVLEECRDEIKDVLFKHFWPQISRRLTQGLPDWYKQELLKAQFGDQNAQSDENGAGTAVTESQA